MGCSGSNLTKLSPVRGSRKNDAGEVGQRQLLDDYSLGKVLGQGAFGIVYLCKKKGMETELAVKMCDKVESPLEDIKREAMMLTKLAHPNVVKLHDVYYEKFFVSMVMDLHTGGDLIEGMQAHWKKRGMIPCDKIPHICRQMMSSIRFLHSMNVVHRDLKGDNYLMDRKNIAAPDCRIYLIDFGTVLEVKPGERLSGKCGTKVYWSPEFYNLNYSFKVDIWAIGVATYGLVCANFPFRGEIDVRNKKVSLPSRCTKECSDYVLRLLEKDEVTRPSGDEAMADPWLTFTGGDSQEMEDLRMTVKPEIGESGNEAVNDRRRELVERLENAQIKMGMLRPTDADTSTLVMMTHERISQDGGFEVYDKHGERTTKYEWWPASDIKEEGMDPKDAARQSFTIVDQAEVKKEERETGDLEVVGKMLSDYNIDTSKFGKDDARTLEEFAREVQTGSTMIMLDAAKHKCMVRAVDIVLLRLYNIVGGAKKFLVQYREQYSDGRLRTDVQQLSGAKKEPYENSVQVAERVVEERLNMCDCKVVFDFDSSEHFEEEEESPSYPGVRTVYRKTIIEGQITNAESLSDKEWSFEDSKNIKRFFRWLSEKQCQDGRVKLRQPPNPGDISALVQAPVGLDVEQLTKYLEVSGLDLSKFGTGTYRSVAEFSSELTNGNARLEKQKDGSILRVVDVVCLKLCKPGSNKTLVEVSEKVGFDINRLDRLPAVKRRPDENHFAAASKVITRLLRADANYVRMNRHNVHICDQILESPFYPGIKSKYRKRFITAEIVS